MNPIILWNWLKKNISLSLLLLATAPLALTLGREVRGATWSLFIPVALAAVLCSWWVGSSRMNSRQAVGWLVGLGIPGLIIYATGMAGVIGNLAFSAFSSALGSILWVYNRTPIDTTALIAAWSELIQQTTVVLSRLGAWIGALAAGGTATDPVATGLAWSILLWFVGIWSGWQLRRNQKALRALAPGGLLLALVLDFTGQDVGLLVLYLANILVLIGVSHYARLRTNWSRGGVDFSESIAFDSGIAILSISILLVGLAAIMPSFSWQDLVERIRETDRNGDDRVAESLGLDTRPNAAGSAAYRSNGLPRQHLLGMPPELLEELVLTVSTGEIPPLPNEQTGISVNRYYWRTITYDEYTSRGWASSPAQTIPLPANTPLMERDPEYRTVRQQVKVVSEQNERVYWAGTLAQADADLEIAWRTSPPPDPDPTRKGDMLGALTTTNDYTVVSFVPQVSAAQLRAAGSGYPDYVIGRYLRLPDTVPERVLAKARELTGTAPTPYDRALAIQSYLRTFPYSLEVEPPTPGRDIVDHFLFSSQAGYCDYYASAMVVLARAAGLPARIVIGYASGTYNWSTAQYEVRQGNAHSWPEIYFPGIGWVEFEPTASLPEITRALDQQTRQPVPIPSSGDLIAIWLKEGWQGLVSTIAGQVLLVGVGLGALIAIWQAVEIWVLYWLPNPEAVHRLYSMLERYSLRLLPDLLPGHTPQGLQEALADRLVRYKKSYLRVLLRPASAEIERIIMLYESQVFSRNQPGRLQVRAGIHAWAHLRWRLRISGWGNKSTN